MSALVLVLKPATGDGAPESAPETRPTVKQVVKALIALTVSTPFVPNLQGFFRVRAFAELVIERHTDFEPNVVIVLARHIRQPRTGFFDRSPNRVLRREFVSGNLRTLHFGTTVRLLPTVGFENLLGLPQDVLQLRQRDDRHRFRNVDQRTAQTFAVPFVRLFGIRVDGGRDKLLPVAEKFDARPEAVLLVPGRRHLFPTDFRTDERNEKLRIVADAVRKICLARHLLDHVVDGVGAVRIGVNVYVNGVHRVIALPTHDADACGFVRVITAFFR